MKIVFINTGAKIENAHFGCPYKKSRADKRTSVPWSVEGRSIPNTIEKHIVRIACSKIFEDLFETEGSDSYSNFRSSGSLIFCDIKVDSSFETVDEVPFSNEIPDLRWVSTAVRILVIVIPEKNMIQSIDATYAYPPITDIKCSNF